VIAAAQAWELLPVWDGYRHILFLVKGGHAGLCSENDLKLNWRIICAKKYDHVIVREFFPARE